MRAASAAVASLLLLLCVGLVVPVKSQEQLANNTLHAQWSSELKQVLRLDGPVIPTSVAVTDASVIVSLHVVDKSASNGLGAMLLASFDRKNGKLRKWREVKTERRFPHLVLLDATSKTFLAEVGDQLAEYDEELEPTNRIQIPRGMRVVLQPGFAYGWLENTKSNCELNKTQAYELDGGRKLVLACGHEAGVADSQWHAIYLERCGPMKALVNPNISQDGRRVVLQYVNDVIEPPSHNVISYVLYDLRAGGFHRTTFDLAEKVDQDFAAVSADGAMFAVVGRDRTHSTDGVPRLCMYELPTVRAEGH